MTERRILFVKQALAWPRSSGHDVHAFHMMKGLCALGQQVGLTTVEPTRPEALEGVALAFLGRLDGEAGRGEPPTPVRLSRWQERFRRYWGVEPGWIRAVDRQAAEFGADAVVAVGLEVLPFLGGLRDVVRVWYAADEWMRHHISQVRLVDRSTWSNAREALVKGAYERVFAPDIDRAWVVSDGERWAMRWLAGVSSVDVVPNGVDADFFRPRDNEPVPRSAVFWGRLDFGPNLQALDWFCSRVWPAVRNASADATLTIVGFRPSDAVRELADRPGVQLVPDLPDLREEVSRHAVAVLPFVSGGGIKNKLLEAAAMGMPVLCSPRACEGLRPEVRDSVVLARRPSEWVERLREIWSDPRRAASLGERARASVERSHSWTATARSALGGIEESLGGG